MTSNCWIKYHMFHAFRSFIIHKKCLQQFYFQPIIINRKSFVFSIIVSRILIWRTSRWKGTSRFKGRKLVERIVDNFQRFACVTVDHKTAVILQYEVGSRTCCVGRPLQDPVLDHQVAIILHHQFGGAEAQLFLDKITWSWKWHNNQSIIIPRLEQQTVSMCHKLTNRINAGH